MIKCASCGTQIAVTMEIYAQASSKSTQDALKRLGDSLEGGG
ncbi:hypothetical protein [Allokutzneria oryzae]|uniref:Uncharacterized protein n=1 Tax=Allokutzneria oryzae TaxID=1378989 RepID=A0ABV5ZUQ0_9PSEU